MKEALEQIQERINVLMARKKQIIIAIDGNCTAGKTTLGNALAEIYDCNVFHMDDFFLRPEQRTPERYEEAGGNVDYERFLEEVLIPLRAGERFPYRPFDCATFLLGEPIYVMPKRLSIIEGTYSQHPRFNDPYDLKIFLTVSPEVQRRRIMKRPAFLHQRFFEEWIPMEHRYFDEFHIRENADMITSCPPQK